jgi:hypothetical protein
VDKM